MTLDEEFIKFDFDDTDKPRTRRETIDWFKSYILSLMESVDRMPLDTSWSKEPGNFRDGYNKAVKDTENRIAEELKKRGI